MLPNGQHRLLDLARYLQIPRRVEYPTILKKGQQCPNGLSFVIGRTPLQAKAGNGKAGDAACQFRDLDFCARRFAHLDGRLLPRMIKDIIMRE